MPDHTFNRVEVVCLSDIGTKKKTNQDRLLARQINPTLQLFAVIDGLGGQPGGEEAAETALATFSGFTPTKTEYTVQLTELLRQANAAIIARGDADPALYNMGATATLLLTAGNHAHWAHIGDCRLYHVRDGLLNQITADHNLAWELFESDDISAEERQHHKFNQFLCQCLGEDDIEPESGDFTLATGDIVLLCTDGIHTMLSEEQITRIITAEKALENRADNLLTAALEAEGNDNISLILLQFLCC